MIAPKFALIAFVFVAFPLLWVVMWWRIAAQAEARTVELQSHPSLRKYELQMVWAILIWGLGGVPAVLSSVLFGRAPSGAWTWAGLALDLIAWAAMCVIWRNRSRELRRLSEQDRP